jgi:hypothetical protein
VISNRFTGDAFTLRSLNTNGFWTAGPGTTISDAGFTELTPALNCRQISLSGGLSNTIYIDPLPGDTSFHDARALFVFGLKAPNGGTVSVAIEDASVSLSIQQIYTYEITAASSSVNAEGVLSPQWSIIRVLTEEFTSPSPSIAINITVDKSVNETVYFTSPVLCPQMEFIQNNIALQYVSGFLPDFMLEDDFTTVAPIDIPLHRFIDISTGGLDDAVRETLQMAYLDTAMRNNDTSNATLSTIVSPEVTDVDRLLWISKFVGTKPVTRFTSSLEIDRDPFLLNSSLLDGEDGLRLTSYSDLNPPTFNAETQRELVQWQVETQSFGFKAGTTQAIEEAVKLMLVGDKTVSLIYDYSIHPFEITIETPWHETIGGDESMIGESSSLVLEAVQKAKPIGVKLTHVMTE